MLMVFLLSFASRWKYKIRLSFSFSTKWKCADYRNIFIFISKWMNWNRENFLHWFIAVSVFQSIQFRWGFPFHFDLCYKTLCWWCGLLELFTTWIAIKKCLSIQQHIVLHSKETKDKIYMREVVETIKGI